MDLTSLLGLSPSSDKLAVYLNTINSSPHAQTPEIKSYPDAVYHNYFDIGLSLLYVPVDGYKPTLGSLPDNLDLARLRLDSVIVYNISKTADSQVASPSSTKNVYSSYPSFPLFFCTSIIGKDGKLGPQETVEVKPGTTGKEFVAAFGEPDRKGGGTGPSSGGIGIWLEWSRQGLMVEFGESKGLQAWEKGKDAIWSVLTAFPPSV